MQPKAGFGGGGGVLFLGQFWITSAPLDLNPFSLAHCYCTIKPNTLHEVF